MRRMGPLTAVLAVGVAGVVAFVGASKTQPTLTIPTGPTDPFAVPKGLADSLKACGTDFSACDPPGATPVPVSFQGRSSELTQAEASWVLLLECGRRDGGVGCPEWATSGGHALVLADNRQEQDLGGDSTRVARATPQGRQSVSSATGGLKVANLPLDVGNSRAERVADPVDYTHPNGPLTHGVGLQPNSRRFPYAIDRPFPPSDGKITSTNGRIYELTNCKPVFGRFQKGPQTCTLKAAQTGEVICPPFSLSSPNDNATINVATVTAVRGAWRPGLDGGFKSDAAELTLSCSKSESDGAVSQDERLLGAITKCIGLAGFCPETAVSYLDACILAVTADYCGDGQSHTVPGVTLNLYAEGKYHQHQQERPQAPLCARCRVEPDGGLMFFEAGWAEDVAVTVSQTRLGTLVNCRDHFKGGESEGNNKQIISRPGRKDHAWLYSRIRGDGGLHSGQDIDCEGAQPLACTPLPACQ
jgi:ADYC domain